MSLLVLGVDPGTKASAMALVRYTGTVPLLGWVSMVPHPNGLAGVEEDVLTAMQSMRQSEAYNRVDPFDVVVEGQEIYHGPRVKQRPNDILKLAQFAGALVSSLGVHASGGPRLAHYDFHVPLPREWKGQKPKRVHQVADLAALGIPSVVSAGKDAYAYPAYPISCGAKVNRGDWEHLADAAGLALWLIRRLNARSVR